MEKIHLIAHRGGYKESNCRENSKEAIKYAVAKDYIDGVEFDVRVTKDNKIILFHDANLKYNNKKYKINNYTYDELNSIYEQLYQQKLNTLEEILPLIPKQKWIFLEIKDMVSNENKNPLDLVYNTIKKYPSKKICIISFIYQYLKYFKAKDYPTCLLMSKKLRFLSLKAVLVSYLSSKVNMISLNKINIKKNISHRILKNNKLLGIYTIDDADEINSLYQKLGQNIIKKYQNEIYITTTNPKNIYERIKLLNEKI